MPTLEFKLPKMGESITEATILNWKKNVGDFIDAEEVLLEVGTDKVDSDVPAPFAGIIKEIRFDKNAVVSVGEVIAIIEADENAALYTSNDLSPLIEKENSAVRSDKTPVFTGGIIQPLGFLSPLLRNIVLKENISLEELQQIPGSGLNGRLQKSDLFNYLRHRKSMPQKANRSSTSFNKPVVHYVEGYDQVQELDRMRKMIADHMVYSKQSAPHVTAYIEIDVTNLTTWRNLVKDQFQAKYNEKLTYTPVFVQAVSRAIADFPMMNVSLDGDRLIIHRDVNIGMATALPNGNLIVPVVKKASEKSLAEIAATVNSLANQARNNKLKPDDIQGSTFTISNVGTFGSLMGTPIINQPESAILAFGVIKRRVEVIQTSNGEEIGIRSMMFLSLSFDHRVVNGHLGGSFLRRVGDYLEQFDVQTTI